MHLRKIGGEWDIEIDSALHAAVEYCEHVSGRALRVSHTLTDTFRNWPAGGCLYFDRQPVSAITSIKYYDLAGTQQTVTSSDYRLRQSTDAAGWVEFDEAFTYPSVDDRGDAIEVIYTVGYATLDDVPAEAKRAILMQLAINFGELDDRTLMAHERARDSLMASMGWGWYR